jgi:copper transport protein
VRTVSATFDESVGVSPDSLRVFDPEGRRVDRGGTHVGSTPSTVQVSLATAQPQGTYTVAWHVVSADTHPVQGAFTFSIGHPSRHVSAASVLHHQDKAASVVYAVDRFLGYAGFTAFAGGLVFLALCWPAGARRRGTHRWLAAAGLLVFASTAAQLPLQAASAAGRSLTGAANPDLVAHTLGTNLGIALLVREMSLVFLAVLGLLLTVDTEAQDSSRWPLGGLLILGSGLAAATWSASGHAVTGGWSELALAADVLHLVAASVWLGGLAMLFGLVLYGPHAPPTPDRVSAVSRFSPLAGWSVLVIVVTGTFQTWRNTRSWPALLETRYGVLVWVKVLLLLLLVTLGYRARMALGTTPPRARPGPDLPDLNRLRRGVAVEAALAAVVLAVTAVLVQTPTAAESYHPVTSATRTFDTGRRTGTVTATVTPSRLGPNRVRIALRSAGGVPYRPAQVTAALTQNDQHIGPIPVDLHSSGRGVYVSRPVALDFVGSWSLHVVVRSDAFNETTVVLPVSIG